MYRVWKTGYVLDIANIHDGGYEKHDIVRKGLLDDILNFFDGFEPGMYTESRQWKNWISMLDPRTCQLCRLLHGKVYSVDEIVLDGPPAHVNFRCKVEMLKAVFSGYATRNGKNGADYWLKWAGQLPEYYISKEEAEDLGWVSWQGNLADAAPGMMIGGGIYKNRNGHLPQAEGRIWYEADINYTGGYRSRHRVLYSNDGLIFVTYDHYQTFVEIV